MAVLRNKFLFKLLIVFLAFTPFKQIKADQIEDAGLLNSFGMPGTIELPSAINLPDGQFSVSSTAFGGTIRVNLSFQILENLTGAFRYARIPSAAGDHRGYFWDRSFDLHYFISKESDVFPSVAIGVRDFIGTGLYSGEYLVATKSIGPKIKFSAGLGWGRFARKNSFSNIFGIRNRGTENTGVGGTFHIGRFFSGDNSPFASLSYQLSQRLQLISEFSSDIFVNETSSSKGFTRRSDINLGLKYSYDPSISVLLTLIHGDALGLTVNMGINPKNSPYKSGIEPAPMPLSKNKIYMRKLNSEDAILDESKRLLDLEGIELKTLTVWDEVIEVAIVNRAYINISQMIGRVARILSLTSPSNVKEFKINIIDYNSNLFISEINIKRQSFEGNELKFDGPDKLWNTVMINNSEKQFFKSNRNDFKKVLWSLYPYLDVMLFDPHAPIRFHVGAELKTKYNISPSNSISGSFKQPLAGTLDDVKRGPKTGLPNVRSDFMYYHRDIDSNLYINYLTFDQYLKPLPNVYTLINIGILELMHAGIRTEVIWKNNKKPYGFGLDLAKVQKRETDGTFRLRNEHHSTYLASLYYDLPNDWIIKIDAGKYLAGDLGSTISLKRTFNNGWQFGAYATLTDVPFSTFGEGSFEKGLTIRAPLNWFTGKKSRSIQHAIIRPITGDGGAKLYLSEDKYLYDVVSEYDRKSISDNWKRVFR